MRRRLAGHDHQQAEECLADFIVAGERAVKLGEVAGRADFIDWKFFRRA